MKKLWTLILICSSLFAKGQSTNERYFILTNGIRMNITDINGITGDTLVFHDQNSLFRISMDSLAEYHHHRSRQSAKGLLIGTLTGTAVGVILGFATYEDEPSKSYNKLERDATVAGDAAAGLLAGGIIGLAIGIASKKDLNVDLRKFDAKSKKEYLRSLIPEY